MSGKIELKVRKSKPKLPWIKYYPGWVWQITGECGNKVNVMPSWNDIENAIKETIIHEMKVDSVMNRRPDAQRYMGFLKDMVKNCTKLQTKIDDFELEEIYLNCIKKNDN